MTSVPTLDQTFHALSNSTRREVLVRLGSGSATVSELAAPFEMALPSFMQHLQVLETSGLVLSQKRGRVRTLRVHPTGVSDAGDWLNQQRGIWEQRFDRLDAYLLNLREDLINAQST